MPTAKITIHEKTVSYKNTKMRSITYEAVDQLEKMASLKESIAYVYFNNSSEKVHQYKLWFT